MKRRRNRNEKSPEDWFEEIEQGLDYRRDYGAETDWARLEDLFYSRQSLSAGPNIILATGDTLLSSLSVFYPKVVVRARDQEHVRSAKVLEAVDNWLMGELEIPEQVEMSILHAFLWSQGVLKIGYDSEWGYDERFEIGDGTYTQIDRKGRLIESGIAKRGMPWVRACLPHDIIVPYGTRDEDDARWIAHRVIRHIDEIRADDKYENVRDLEPMLSQKDFVESYRSVRKVYRMGQQWPNRGGTGKAEYCELFEIHDARTRRVLVICTGYGKFLRNDEDLLQLDGLPFVSMSLVPRARSFWVTPDAYYLQQPQAELNDIALQASKQRRITCLKALAHKSAFDDEELDKAISADVGVVALVNDGVPLDEAIKLLGGHSNVWIYQDADHVRRNARELVGFSRNRFGEYETVGRRTATEAGIVERAAQARIARRQKALSRVYRKVVSKINQILFEFWSSERVIELVGPEGAEWVRFSGDSLRGDYSYEIELTSEPPVAEETRRRRALELYMLLRQDPMIDPQGLAEFLVSAFGDPELEGIFAGRSRNRNAPLRVQMPEMLGAGGAGAERQEPEQARQLPAV